MTLLSIVLFCSVLVIFLIPATHTGIPIAKNGPCTPGELVWVECNLCTCNPQGMPNPVCAKMWCQPTPALKEAKAIEEARAKQLELEKQKEEVKEEVELKGEVTEEVEMKGDEVKEIEIKEEEEMKAVEIKE